MDNKKLSFGILAIPVGVFFIVFGEYDDSPGGQMLGLIAVVFGVVTLIRSKRKKS